jgi:hypothetical protein
MGSALMGCALMELNLFEGIRERISSGRLRKRLLAI